MSGEATPSYGCYANVLHKGRLGSLTVMPSALIFTVLDANNVPTGKERSWPWAVVKKHFIKSVSPDRHLIKLILHKMPAVIMETSSKEDLEKMRSDIAAAMRVIASGDANEDQEDRRKLGAIGALVRSEEGPTRRRKKSPPRKLKSLPEDAGRMQQPNAAIREASQQLDMYKRNKFNIHQPDSKPASQQQSATSEMMNSISSPNAAIRQASQELNAFKRDPSVLTSSKTRSRSNSPKSIPNKNALPKSPKQSSKTTNPIVSPKQSSKKPPSSNSHAPIITPPNAAIRQASQQLDNYKREARNQPLDTTGPLNKAPKSPKQSSRKLPPLPPQRKDGGNSSQQEQQQPSSVAAHPQQHHRPNQNPSMRSSRTRSRSNSPTSEPRSHVAKAAADNPHNTTSSRQKDARHHSPKRTMPVQSTKPNRNIRKLPATSKDDEEPEHRRSSGSSKVERRSEPIRRSPTTGRQEQPRPRQERTHESNHVPVAALRRGGNVRRQPTPGAVAIQGINQPHGDSEESSSSSSEDPPSPRTSADRNILVEAELVEGSTQFAGDIIVEAQPLQEREMRCRDAWKSRRMRLGFFGLACVMLLLIVGIVLGFTLSRDTGGDDQAVQESESSAFTPINQTGSGTPIAGTTTAAPQSTTNPTASAIQSPTVTLAPTSGPSSATISATMAPTRADQWTPGSSLAPGGGFDFLNFLEEWFMFDGVPASTLRALQDSASAQSRAREWLLQDRNLELYDIARVMQRFALATFYYATNGENWSLNSLWLEYDVHECQWYNNKEACHFDGTTYTQFALIEEGLTGTLPPEFFWITTMICHPRLEICS
ncbi:Leucine Rich Repeat [Seminavis robusta]|uniref:Leucine Rich Repeat n=1 Tax=Seminavis robusta TaxID=568900 RepID=A0A9N8EBD8_9STRA|nr:Leucine Rich Repeat [Seminavis robusta]|eukprot:Sro839_g209220.1 Leucine Rich Repeat (823) ;mRNA; r:3553-6416